MNKYSVVRATESPDNIRKARFGGKSDPAQPCRRELKRNEYNIPDHIAN